MLIHSEKQCEKKESLKKKSISIKKTAALDSDAAA